MSLTKLVGSKSLVSSTLREGLRKTKIAHKPSLKNIIYLISMSNINMILYLRPILALLNLDKRIMKEREISINY